MIPADRRGDVVSTLPGLDDVAEPSPVPSPSLADAALRERRRIVAQLRAAGLYLAADIVERGARLEEP